MLKELTMAEFEELKEIGDLFVIDFYADWCEKCTVMTPIMEEISEMFPDVPMFKVDVDKFPEIKESARIKAIPMIVMYARGHIREFSFGIVEKEKLLSKLTRVGKIYDKRSFE